jgi:hypothetical protein
VISAVKGATTHSTVQGAKVKPSPTPAEIIITPTTSVNKYVTPTSVIPPQN